MKLKITYNSPVILTFTLVSLGVLLCNTYLYDLGPLLSLPGNFPWHSPQTYFRFISYTCVHANSNHLGQADFGHFIGNFTLILLIGPILEEKYGAKKLLLMMVMTAVITGALNCVISDVGIIGASGLAFMMILLGSFTNYRKGDLPLTVIIIAIFFMGNEIIGSFANDNISQFAHIMGGAIGAIFGFYTKGE
ncbi:MAG: rhomboid family intramembrane serine protease [Lentisphaeraceae bacterium]|nr:rhomboid family intramembrane serine protease [Lentisphaeraceae bacterium]